MLTDIEISQQNKMEPIEKVAETIGLLPDDLELYGKYKAKLSYESLNKIAKADAVKGKLILVTAVTPTAAGEGKSTVSIGLGDALRKIGKKTVIALREPSLGPCFGIKGGAAGGGYSQIVPMDEINLHFTGDFHAITAANNLLAAMIDNHIYQGNELNINPDTVVWRRCLDVNDRALRDIELGVGKTAAKAPRGEHFNITAASEVMAIFCLSENLDDLKARLENIVIGQNYAGEDITAKDLNAAGAMAVLLKDALKPNLVQTLEKTPALVHGGPFANIAHGCNSVIATKAALNLADYVVTEAGFGADLGAEKFLDIKCRSGKLHPDAIVIVATIRALKMHGGVAKDNLAKEDVEAVEKGFANLRVHIENMQKYGVPVMVAVNRFVSDSAAETEAVVALAEKHGVTAVVSDSWSHGGAGALEAAETVVKLTEQANNFQLLYGDDVSLIEKLRKVAQEIYRAKDIALSPLAVEKLNAYIEKGYGHLPVCIAKTQNSISHDKNLAGAPQGYILPIRDVALFAGAGFVVILAGDILTMPGLPKKPAAENIDLDAKGVISGLF